MTDRRNWEFIIKVLTIAFAAGICFSKLNTMEDMLKQMQVSQMDVRERLSRIEGERNFAQK